MDPNATAAALGIRTEICMEKIVKSSNKAQYSNIATSVRYSDPSSSLKLAEKSPSRFTKHK